MDTRRLEQIAETQVTSKLLEAGILPTKPFFDHLGADLIGFTSVDDQGRFCRIQCKYRTLKKKTAVTIDASYVVGAFVLFVCLQIAKETRLYCFTAEDIAQLFKYSSIGSHSVYRLGITLKSTLTLDEYDYLMHSQERNAAIFHLMKVASPNAELRKVIVGLRVKMQELTELQRKREDLRELMHQIEMAELEKKVSEEKIEIMEEYAQVLEKQIQEQKHHEEGAVDDKNT